MTRLLLGLVLTVAQAGPPTSGVTLSACLVRPDAPLPACAGGPPAPPPLPVPPAVVASGGLCTCTCVDGAARLVVEDPWTQP